MKKLCSVYGVDVFVNTDDQEVVDHVSLLLNKTKTISELPELLTLREVSELFRVTTLTIKRWQKSKGLEPIRINSRGDRRYKKGQIIELLKGKKFNAS